MTELEEFCVQIALVEQQLASLKQKRNRLAVPLFRLPDEVIVEVVACIQDGLWNDEDGSTSSDAIRWVQLMQVCRHLRTVLVEAPRLWSMLPLSRPVQQPKPKIIDVADPCALVLLFHSRAAAAMPNRLLMSTGVWPRFLYRMDITRILANAQDISVHLSEANPSLTCLNRSWPQLKHLEIRHSVSLAPSLAMGNMDISPKWLGGSSRSLTSLRLLGISCDMEAFPELPQLECLSITKLDPRLFLGPRPFLGRLRHGIAPLTRLRELDLRLTEIFHNLTMQNGFTNPSPDTPVILPDLHYLNISAGPRHIEALVSLFSDPSETLSLHLYHDQSQDAPKVTATLPPALLPRLASRISHGGSTVDERKVTFDQPHGHNSCTRIEWSPSQTQSLDTSMATKHLRLAFGTMVTVFHGMSELLMLANTIEVSPRFSLTLAINILVNLPLIRQRYVKHLRLVGWYPTSSPRAYESLLSGDVASYLKLMKRQGHPIKSVTIDSDLCNNVDYFRRTWIKEGLLEALQQEGARRII